MAQFGYQMDNPLIVHQDNTSAVWIVKNGGNWARTKHLLIRKNKAKESMLNGTINIQHCSTTIMRADMGTKPLSYRMIMAHLDGIGMMEVTRPGGKYTLSKLQVPAEKLKEKKDRMFPISDKVKKARANVDRIEKEQKIKTSIKAKKSNVKK